jgi:hypothetical protein
VCVYVVLFALIFLFFDIFIGKKLIEKTNVNFLSIS